jgi:hypothetical protein
MSIIYTQIEVGLFSQFFSTSFDNYGYLASSSFCAQLWSELEPNGLILRPASSVTWFPTPLAWQDKAFMSIATSVFKKTGSAMINQCTVYLRVILFMIY